MNAVPFHIDFVCKAATITVDDQVIITEGQVKIRKVRPPDLRLISRHS